MSQPISKTAFLDFLFCPKNLWFKLHKPELLDKFVLSDYEQHLADEGNEVEAYARNLFPSGVEVKAYGDVACRETAKLMAAKAPAIFQATFIIDGFLARNDVLALDANTNCWHLYEVKGRSTVHETGGGRNHLDDLAFQLSVLKRSKVSVSKCFVIHLNSEYIRVAVLDIEQLFRIEDVTDKVVERLPTVEAQMEVALEYLSRSTEPPQGCECIYRGRSNQCTTFQYSNPHVPAYSVHDLSRIGASKKKLLWLVENKIFDLRDVPAEGIELSETKCRCTSAAHRRSISTAYAANSSGVSTLLFRLRNVLAGDTVV
jgi:hypothetical protein